MTEAEKHVTREVVRGKKKIVLDCLNRLDPENLTDNDIEALEAAEVHFGEMINAASEVVDAEHNERIDAEEFAEAVDRGGIAWDTGKSCWAVPGDNEAQKAEEQGGQ